MKVGDLVWYLVNPNGTPTRYPCRVLEVETRELHVRWMHENQPSKGSQTGYGSTEKFVPMDDVDQVFYALSGL